MKTILRLLAAVLLMAMLVPALASCGVSEEPTTNPDATTNTPSGTTSTTTEQPTSCVVSIVLDEHSQLNSPDAPTSKTVPYGGNVTFYVFPQSGYMITSVSGATYDADSGKVKLENVTQDTQIVVETARAGKIDVTLTGSNFTAEGGNKQETTAGQTVTFKLTPAAGYVISGVSAGTYDIETGVLTIENIKDHMEITVSTALSENLVQVSVTGKNFTVEGSTVVVAEKGSTVEFTITPAKGYLVSSVIGGEYDPKTGKITVANVQTSYQVQVTMARPAFVYHLNDGSSATIREELDLTFYSAPNCKWDDGTFERSGYVLVEYNTMPDGTGKSYSLGSKVTLDGTAETDLYCIWAPENVAAQFSFSSYTVSFTYSYTSWVGGKHTVTETAKFQGYIITAYTGNDETVVLPTMYNGKPVVAVKAGAFNGKTSMKTLVIPKSIKEVQDGAFVGCSGLDTLYFSDSVLKIANEAFDAATYSNLHHFYLNATMAPRYTNTFDGMYRVKWDAVVSATQPRLVILSGSSTLWGVASKYLEALLDGQYDVINYGTIRTTSMRLYLEALTSELGAGDILIYAPENSSAYTMGGGKLDTFKIFRDTEGVYNIYRHVDIANYTDYFNGLADFNKQRYGLGESNYLAYNSFTGTEQNAFQVTYPGKYSIVDQDGDLIAQAGKDTTKNGTPTHKVNFNDYVADEKEASTVGSNITTYAPLVKAVLDTHEKNGVTTYFGFAPVNRNAIVGEGITSAGQKAYDARIAELYGVDVLGSCSNHIFDWNKCFNNDAHHLTDQGRVLHTYQFYLELCAALGLEVKYTTSTALGTNFPGCKW